MSDIDPRAPKARYNFDIFGTRAVRKEELNGTPYRYWHSYAIAHILSQRLQGTVDVLDAGGRDGGTLSLLRNLGLRGSYTCLDRQPAMLPAKDPQLAINVVSQAFQEFRPEQRYDVVIFQGCLEFVLNYEDLAWVAGCLKPGGFVVATLHCRSTRRLYRVYRSEGGAYPLDESELGPAFARIGLRIVDLLALVGLTGRLCQHVMNSGIAYYPQEAFRQTIGRIFPKLRTANLLGPINHVLNPLTARLDYLFRCGRIGHCLVLEPVADHRK